MVAKLRRQIVRTVWISVLLVLSLSVTVGAIERGLLKKMKTEQRVALIIGNGAYHDAPLRNPVNDARAMTSALRACGFRVMEKTNCDRREMRQAIRDFGNWIKRGGVGVFYYAGHGIQVKGENYLVPVGADVQVEDEVEDECILASSVLRKMESAGNRVNIVIMDAWRNNPWGNSISHDQANYSGTGGKDRWNGTAPVGSFSPTGVGLYDVAGNV